MIEPRLDEAFMILICRFFASIFTRRKSRDVISIVREQMSIYCRNKEQAAYLHSQFRV